MMSLMSGGPRGVGEKGADSGDEKSFPGEVWKGGAKRRKQKRYVIY